MLRSGMADVDPFVIQWPLKWQQDAEIRPVITYLNRFLHDLWQRTGGGDDLIEGIANESATINNYSESFASNAIQSLEQIEDLIPVVIPVVFYSAIKTSSYTAVHGDFIEAQNQAIITLDPNAQLDDEIIIANGDNSDIKVVGAIKYTKLDSSLIVSNQGDSFHFQNFGDYWRVK